MQARDEGHGASGMAEKALGLGQDRRFHESLVLRLTPRLRNVI